MFLISNPRPEPAFSFFSSTSLGRDDEGVSESESESESERALCVNERVSLKGIRYASPDLRAKVHIIV